MRCAASVPSEPKRPCRSWRPEVPSRPLLLPQFPQPCRYAMRVLHCIPTLGGGGAERQLAYLAAELRVLGWEVHIAYGHDGPYCAVLAQAGAVLHRVHGRGNHDPRLLWQLRRLISKIQPDVVQTWLFQMDI